MKKKILKFLLSKTGSFLRPFIATAIGAGATQLARVGVELTPEQQLEVTAWVSGAIVVVGQWALDRAEAPHKEKVQEALGVPQDNYIGPETAKAAVKVSAVAEDASPGITEPKKPQHKFKLFRK